MKLIVIENSLITFYEIVLNYWTGSVVGECEYVIIFYQPIMFFTFYSVKIL